MSGGRHPACRRGVGGGWCSVRRRGRVGGDELRLGRETPRWCSIGWPGGRGGGAGDSRARHEQRGGRCGRVFKAVLMWWSLLRLPRLGGWLCHERWHGGLHQRWRREMHEAALAATLARPVAAEVDALLGRAMLAHNCTGYEDPVRRDDVGADRLATVGQCDAIESSRGMALVAPRSCACRVCEILHNMRGEGALGNTEDPWRCST